MEYLKELSIDKIRNVAEDVFNQTKPKSEVEARVYEVLSHKNWGASSTLLNEIARDTFDSEKFYTVTRLMWENLESPRPSAWRVVFKGMTLLEHLIKNGSERCVDDARNHSHALKSLYNFNYYEGNVDRGIGVREMAKKIVETLADDDTIRDERAKAKQLRDKFGARMDAVGSQAATSHSTYAGYGNDSSLAGSRNFAMTSSSNISSSSSSSSGFREDRYSGRYSDTNHESTLPTTSKSIPTASLSKEESQDHDATHGDKKKFKKKSKKKSETTGEEDITIIPSPPMVDLLALEDTAASSTFVTQKTSAPPPPVEDEFDAFQSASSTAAASKDPLFDPFGEFVSTQRAGHTSDPKLEKTPFDPFDMPLSRSHATVSTSHSHTLPISSVQDAFGNLSVSNRMTSAPNTFLQSPQQPILFPQNTPVHSNFLSGSSASGSGSVDSSRMASQLQGKTVPTMSGRNVKATSVNDEDAFGEFEGVAAPKVNPSTNDPLSKLVSLESLSSNKKKPEDKLKEPILFHDTTTKNIKEKEPISTPFAFDHVVRNNFNVLSNDSSSFHSSQPIMSSNIMPGMMHTSGVHGMMGMGSSTTTREGMNSNTSAMYGGTVMNPQNAYHNSSFMGGNNMGGSMGMNTSIMNPAMGANMNSQQGNRMMMNHLNGPPSIQSPGNTLPYSTNTGSMMGGRPMGGWD